MLDRDVYSYIVPHYSGHIPAHILEQDEDIQKKKPTAHIPGYKGYVPSIKSENLIGETYGKITERIAKGNYHQGQDYNPMIRYTSANREAYINLRNVVDKKVADVVGVNPP